MTAKTIPAGLLAHYQGDCLTLAYGLKITRTDATVYAFTSADQAATIGGTAYLATQGLDVASITTSAGLDVDNLELSTADDGSIFARADVLGGVWANAAFSLIRYNWADLSNGVETLLAGTLGDVTLLQGQVRAELRGLQQYLQQPVGAVCSPTCRVALGSTLCGVNLAPFTFAGTLTSVTSNQVFRDSGRAQAADYFKEGIITFTGGLNNGRSARIVGHLANGTFTVFKPMMRAVAIGDTYSVHAGCTKRFAEDCIAKFANGLNFQGEPHVPTIDTLTAAPPASA